MNRSATDGKVAAWGEACRLGVASAACDRIVRSRPVPTSLLIALGRVEEGYDPSGRFTRWQECPLTLREREILRCFGCGMRSRDVSALLGISRDTVMTHKRRIRAKLGARSFTHAYALAFRSNQLA